MANQAMFAIQEDLTAIAIAFRNQRMIADDVLPRVGVGSQVFRYNLYNQSDDFTVPNTLVGRKGATPRAEWNATRAQSETVDFGLEDALPVMDIEQGRRQNMDVRGRTTSFLTNLLMLDREIRVAATVFNTSNFVAGNQATLSGTSQWSDYTNSNPLSAIMSALDVPLMRPNLAVFGQDTWRVLRQHPRIVEAVRGTGAGVNAQGTITQQQLAELLEIEAVYVGQGFLNTARKGQTASYSRVWGKHAAFLYRDSLASADQGTTYGFSAQFGDRLAMSYFDPNAGMRGSEVLRVGESVIETVSAPALGYYFQNAVA